MTDPAAQPDGSDVATVDDEPVPALTAQAIAIYDGVRHILDEAQLSYEADDATASLALDFSGNLVYLNADDGCLYAFLPMFDDDGATPRERAEAAAFLAERLAIPSEYDGMARYQDWPYGQTGLMVEMIMPRTFSELLLSDGMDLISETIEGWAALAAAAGDEDTADEA